MHAQLCCERGLRGPRDREDWDIVFSRTFSWSHGPIREVVYAFNRPTGVRKLHEKLFRPNSLDLDYLNSPKLRPVEGHFIKPHFLSWTFLL